MDTDCEGTHVRKPVRQAIVRPGTSALCVALAVLGVVSLLLAGSPQGGGPDGEQRAGQVSRISSDTAFPEVENLSRAFRVAAKRVLPAVVVVKTSSDPQATDGPGWRTQQRADMHFRDEEEVEEYYFEEEVAYQPGLASGVLIDPSGTVLTNQHVIEDADRVTVLLPDGREFAVKQIRPVPGIDLAVLQLDSKERLPAATLGDSDALEIGDWVLTVGCPLELEQTVSAGIVSAKGRTVPDAGRTRLLQTDAAINPGSSGGPLVNLRGEVVGITTAIASEDGGYQGIGFAIPINLFQSHEGPASTGRAQR